MAERYGKLPTAVAKIRPGEYTRLQEFRLNQSIFRATEQYKEKQRDNHDPDSGGVGSKKERESLVQDQIDRADEEHGSLADQQAAL